MLGAIADENAERIKRQNRRKISVIIGNPPYNANQQNENQNNKNREYKRIDERIKQTYIKASTAQKTKLYDMYARFYRWATDRLSDEGIVAFVTNSSFLEARTFDGFRKKVAQDFSEAWVIDLKGNARTSGERRRREGGNVFEDKIKVGVAIAFFVRRKDKRAFQLHYLSVSDYARQDDKREFVASTDLSASPFKTLRPNENGDWLDLLDESDWSSFLPIADAKTKSSTETRKERAIFKLYSLGVVTARDDWVFGWSDADLDERLLWFVSRYEAERNRLAPIDKRKRRDAIRENEIKLTRALKNDLAANVAYAYEPSRNRKSLYRPFIAKRLHFWPRLNEMLYRLGETFPLRGKNWAILLSGHPSKKPFQALGTNAPHSYHTLEDTESLPRYRYTKSGERLDNITDWALKQFEGHYGKAFPCEGRGTVQNKNGAAAPPGPRPSPGNSKKDAIFAYCYAVLHDPVYREKYALNLKREFPRIPFYDDFATWTGWGQQLLDLHIGYEQAEPFAFTRIDTPNPKRAKGSHPKPKLKSDPDKGSIVVDEDTQLIGIPREAWDYRLGNRSAIDWVLDQHKEKTPRDPTVRAKFNTYRFADYKESMIALLARVITVSLATVRITDAMRSLERGEQDVD